MMLSKRLAGTAASMAIAAFIGVAAPAAQAAPAIRAAPSVRTASASYAPPAGVVDPCPPSSPGLAGCAALTSAPGTARKAAAAVTPGGYAPADLRKAYALQSDTAGSGQTVAVVTPYDDPSAAADLAAYRSQYGISPCTVADGCFRQVSQTGTSSLPPAQAGWSTAVAESIDMISAICPNCHILVVEAKTSAIADLGTAENEAAALGGTSVVNDWYIPEAQLGSTETTYDSQYFNHPGVAITAPGSDDGYDVSYPAASPYVTAVGGTTLTAGGTGARGFTETAWAGSNSGCSAYEPKPSWQADTGCTTRTLNDLAADADPNTPVAYYDTPTEAGWGEGSGTVAAAAIIAAAYALAGAPGASDYPASYPYKHPGGGYTAPGTAYTSPTGLNPVTAGSDGVCSVAYLCTAGTGYNGPAGLGSPASPYALTSGGASANDAFYSGVTGKCLDDNGQKTTAGNKIDIYSCNGSAAQNWTAQPDGLITVTISGNTPATACLGTAGTTSGSLVQTAACDASSASDQWATQANGSLVNAATGMCLDDPSVSVTDGTQLELWACNGGYNQAWTAPYARPAATGYIKTKISSGKCVADTNGATTNGNVIQIWDCLGNAAQYWNVQPTSTLQLHGQSGCLTAANDGMVNATPIVYYTCDGDPSQHWAEHSDGSLVNIRSGLCLADPDADDTNGVQLQLSPCNSQVQQTWDVP